MTNDTKIVVSNLEAGAIYNVFVVSKNDFGSSLPSSIVMISIKKTGMSHLDNMELYSIIIYEKLQKIKLQFRA